MCNVFSGHIVTDEESKDWGKLLIVTGEHHEVDREHKSVRKYGGKIAAWETIAPSLIERGVKLVHDAGQGLNKETKEALTALAGEQLKRLGYDGVAKEIYEKTGEIKLSGVERWPCWIQKKINGDLDLRDTNVTELPEGLSVGGYLDLRYTNVTELPEGLSVGRGLYLRDTNVTELPEGLSVGGYLDLEGTNVTELPEGLSVGGGIYIRGSQIKEIPIALKAKVRI